MTQRVEDVTIVGGGTAGWLAAHILAGFLNSGREGPPVRVTLIESPKVPTVGVGEATAAGLPLLLNQLGIDEAAFIRRCNASFKLSVRFDGWCLDDKGERKVFYHPFNYPPHLAGFNAAYYYRKYGPLSGDGDLADSVVVNTALLRARRGPRKLGGANYEEEIAYAYHLDAGLFAKFLREVALERGVRHIEDDVVDVVQDENGFITALQLEQGGRHPVELVVDCTGFRGRILQQVLGEPFESFGDELLCDRAIPLQLPHRDPRRIPPCTGSTALGAGWVWRVPLYSRLGTGYVFSSAFRSEDEAFAELVDHLRERGDLTVDPESLEPRVIRMQIGRTRRAWVKNCVAIGLSGGFLEPLESTAIAMTENSVRWLVGLFPDKAMNPQLARRYNAKIAALYDEVRNFIIAHYVTGNRPEPFWRTARDDVKMPDGLRENLELWRHVLPDETDTLGQFLFNHWNYMYVLWPKGHFDGDSLPLEGSISRRWWEAFSQSLAKEKADLIATLPDHVELLDDIRGEAAPSAPVFALPGDYQQRASRRASVPLPGS